MEALVHPFSFREYVRHFRRELERPRSSSREPRGQRSETCVLLERRVAEVAYVRTASGSEVGFLAQYTESRQELLQEPLADGKIGRGMIDGVTPVRIVPLSGLGTRLGLADIVDGECSYLEAGRAGSATILWREGGIEEEWAIVRLGGEMASTSWVGKLVSAGPGEEADYTDRRYWVREVNPDTLSILSGGRWVTAKNLAERGDSLHNLPVSTTNIYVTVHQLKDEADPPVLRYVFAAGDFWW